MRGGLDPGEEYVTLSSTQREGLPQTNNANGVDWRTSNNPPIEAERFSSGLANSQDPPAEVETAAQAGTKHDGYVQEFTARMYALRATRARVDAGVCVMNAVAPFVAHDAWMESHRCGDNGGRVDQ